MKILFLAPDGSYPLRIKGPTKVAFYLVKEFIKKRIEVDYVFGVSKSHCMKIEDLSDALGFSGNINLIPVIRNRSYSDSYKTSLDFMFFRDILRYVKKSYNQYDIVHFCNIPNSKEILVPLIARFKKIPLVYTAHGWVTHERFYGNKSKYDYFSYRILERFFTKIVCVSSWIKKKLILEGNKPQKLEVVHNGVDPETFRNAGKIELAGNPVLLFIGRLEYVKGIDVLLRSMRCLRRELPEAILHVIGRGSLRDSLQDYIDENNLNNVILHDFIPNEALPSYFNSSSICIFPSRYEPCSLAILEALAAGRPIIATKVGGIPEIINNLENGILIKLHKKALTKSVCSLWNSKSLMDRFRRNNLRKARKNDWKNAADQYIKIYQTITN